jgi:hypothetical protein
MARKGSASTRFHAVGPVSDQWTVHGSTNTAYSNISTMTAVGIGINYQPQHRLTVQGSISSSDTLYTSGGNSKEWESVYASVSEVSGAKWDQTHTTVNSYSADWEHVWTEVNSLSDTWNYTKDVTPGTVAVSKAVIVDSNKDIDGFRNVTIDGNLTVMGATVTLSSVDTLVKDKLITLNDGGLSDSGHNVGFEIEESGSITGYIKTGITTSDDDKWLLKAPDGNVLTLDINADKTLTVAGNLNVEGDTNVNQDLTSDSSPTFASAIISKLLLEPAGHPYESLGGAVTTSTGDLYLYSVGGTVHINDNLSIANQATDVLIKDNAAESLTFQEGTNRYVSIDTLDSAEHVRIWKTLSLTDNLSADQNMFIAGGASLSGSVTLLGGLTANATHHHTFLKYIDIPSSSTSGYSIIATGGAKFGNGTNQKLTLDLGYITNAAPTYFDITKSSDNNNPGIAFRNKSDDSMTSMVVDPALKRVGINTVAPVHTLHVAGDVGISEFLYHAGDIDTGIQFLTDSVIVSAGGVRFISITEDGSQDNITFNDDGVDVDFIVESGTRTNALFVSGAGAAAIGVGHNTPETYNDISDIVSVAGNLSARNYMVTNYAVVSGNSYIHGKEVIEGDSNIKGNLDVNTNLNVDGSTTLNGNTIIGDHAGDSLTVYPTTITLPASMTFDGAGDITLDAADADIVLKHAGTESGKFTQNGATSLTLDVVGDLVLDADGGNITFKDSATQGLDFSNSGGDWTIKPLTEHKDIIFVEDGGNEIARFDSSAESLLISTDKKIEFRDNTEYIHSGANGHIDHVAVTEIHLTAPTVNIDASSQTNVSNDLYVGGDLHVNGTTTRIDSTVTTITDPVITIGMSEAAVPSSDDNKDRGIEFTYHTGTVGASGFFGYDDNTGRFTFIPNALNTGEVFSVKSGNLGDIEVGGGILGNVRVGFTGDNEIDTSSGNLVLDSTGGTVSVDDILSVVGESHLASNVGIRNTAADEALHVTGNTRVTGSLSAQGGGYNYIANRLGIGTLYPTDILTVAGSISASDVLATTHANLSGNLRVTGNANIQSNLTVEGVSTHNGNVILGNASGDSITTNAGSVVVANTLNFDSNTLVINPSTDLISIGTASGDAKLQIESSSNKFGQLALSYSSTRTSYLSTDSDGDLHIRPRSGRHASFGANDVYLRKIVSENANNVTIQASAEFIVTDGSTNWFRLDSNGDAAFNMAPTSNAKLSILDSSSDQLRLHYDSNNYAQFRIQSSGVLKITNTHSAGAMTGALYISGGRLGINQTAPDYALTVGNAYDGGFGMHVHSYGSIGTTPPIPGSGEGGILYTDAGGALNWISNGVQQGIELSKSGLNKNGKVQVTGNDGILPISKSANAGGFGDEYTSVGCIDAIMTGALAHGYASGSSAAKIQAHHPGDFAGGHASTGTIHASGAGFGSTSHGGSMAFGLSESYGTIKTHRGGAFAFGNAYGGGGGYGGSNITGGLSAANYGSVAMGLANRGLISSMGKGAFALGAASANYSSSSYDSNASIHAGGTGSFAMGHANMDYGSSFGAGESYVAEIKANGAGSFAMGYASVDSSSMMTNSINKDVRVYTTGSAKGAFAVGCAIAKQQKAIIKSHKNGSFAMGHAESGTIYANGVGAIAGGFVKGYTDSGSFGGQVANYKISANAAGTMAFGYARNAYINANNEGAIALGFADGANIAAGGKGSFAIGYAKSGAGGAIQTSAKNAAQFGYGLNNVDNSLSVGGRLRMRNDNFAGITSHPSSNVRDGDMWVRKVGSSYYVYVRSGGSSIKIA